MKTTTVVIKIQVEDGPGGEDGEQEALDMIQEAVGMINSSVDYITVEIKSIE